jgi:hypothetical protein
MVTSRPESECKGESRQLPHSSVTDLLMARKAAVEGLRRYRALENF